MSKITLNEVTNVGQVSTLNDNFAKISEYIETRSLSRSNPSASPNQLEEDIDVNGKRIYNLAEPTSPSEPARLQDVQNSIAGAAANLIAFTPVGDIVATTVQGAIAEVDSEMHAADAVLSSEMHTADAMLSESINSLTSGLTAPSGSSLVGYMSGGVGAINSTVQTNLRRNVTVEDFGAVGNGIVDDSAAIQAAVTYAASLGIGLNGRGKTYGIRNVRLLNGLKFFKNFGLKAVVGGQQAILELAGYSYFNAPVGVQTRATEIKIENNSLDCNSLAPMGVFGQSNTVVTVRGNKIFNIPSSSSNSGIQFAAGTFAEATAPSRIHIYDNDITLPTTTVLGDTVNGIVVSGATHPDAYNPPVNYTTTGGITQSSIVASEIHIKDNRILNGYYAVAFQGIHNSEVKNNVFTGQMRAVQMIDCRNVTVQSNRAKDFVLSAVNCSFGSFYNLILDNDCDRTLVAVDAGNHESVINCYVFTRGNRIMRNRVKTNGRFGIYVAVDCSDNIVSQNRVEGATIAQISVEANWINGQAPASPALAVYSRASSTPSALAATMGVQVVDNDIVPTTGSCAIYFSCLGTGVAANECVISNNRIYGTAAHYLYVVGVNETNNSTNAISGLKVTQNRVFDGDQSVSRIYINRTGNGRAAFSECHGNSIINILPAHANFNNLDATPYVDIADEWVAGYTVATNITAFQGGMIGQRINIHLATNVTLVHSTNISLKGGVNATVPANPSRGLISLRYFDRWVEEYRNF